MDTGQCTELTLYLYEYDAWLELAVPRFVAVCATLPREEVERRWATLPPEYQAAVRKYVAAHGQEQTHDLAA